MTSRREIEKRLAELEEDDGAWGWFDALELSRLNHKADAGGLSDAEDRERERLRRKVARLDAPDAAWYRQARDEVSGGDRDDDDGDGGAAVV